jgi:signal transduction histidine kinase
MPALGHRYAENTSAPAPPRPVELSVVPTRMRQPLNILLIDDSIADHELYRRFLSVDESHDFELTAAATPEDGIRLAQQHHYDCVLLDYRMPRMNGMDVLKTLQGDRRTRTLPVIMLTGQGSESVAVDALHGGAADYVPKDKASPGVFRRAILNAVEKSRLRMTVADKTRHLEMANETLRHRQEEIQRVYQTMSHEIKTPLTAAREFISIVRDGISGPVSEQQAEYLELAIESCDQLASHFNDLIDTARLDTGKLRLDRHPTAVGRLVMRATASVASAARAKNITVTRRIPSGLPLVCVDPGRIVQVIANLLWNAVKYTPADGRIVISASRIAEPWEGVQIAVEDTGGGIRQADLERIFERLFQVSPTTSDPQAGLGLGLSIARELVRLHGGDITAESALGAGSIFRFTLPSREVEAKDSIPVQQQPGSD